MSATKKVLLLFANRSVRQGKADPPALQALLRQAAAAHDKDYEVYVSYARSLSYLITNDKCIIRDHRNHFDLQEYDFAYLRKAGASMQQMQACAFYLHDHGVPFFDQEILKANSRNKLSQMAALQRKQLPIPATLFCRNKRRLLRLIAQDYADIFQFPVIAKATGGTRGDANYLVKSLDELAALLKSSRRHFLIQECIPNDGDYRLFVAGGQVRGVIHRQASGDTHLNNTSQGATATLHEISSLDRTVLNQAVEAAYTFRRDCAGVDMMLDSKTGEAYILEVNRAPQIEGASFEAEKADWLIAAIDEAIATEEPKSKVTSQAQRIGRLETVYICGDNDSKEKIIAKVDTGADSSSIHAQDIQLQDGQLQFKIGDLDFLTSEFWTKKVKSSNGQYQDRYMVVIKVRIGEQYYDMKTSLADRSQMNHEMLLGRKFLRSNKFVVDVSRRYTTSGKKRPEIS